MKKVSVIVPVYNVEKCIYKCIESILNQTFTDFELILVDDGSTDDSGIICDEYATKDSRISVIHKKNSGLSEARNYGIVAANGEYLSFIDSDDWVEEDFLKVLYENAIKYRAEIVAVNLHKVYDNGAESKLHIEEACYSGKEVLNCLYGKHSIYMNVACNKLYKRTLFDNIRYPVGKTHEDGFTTYKLLNLCNKVYLSDYDGYCYYQRSDSIMNRKFSESRIDEYFVYNERREYFKKYNLEEIGFENEKTIIACIKSLTLKIAKSDWEKDLKQKYYNKFKEDLKKNYKCVRRGFTKKQRLFNDIYMLSPRLFIYASRIKNRLKRMIGIK